MCLIVIATKLSQPFDDIVRYPETQSDPTTVRIDWAKWREIMSEKESDGLKRGEEIKITDADIIGMSDKGLDGYLDWYQRTWTTDSDHKSKSCNFPLGYTDTSNSARTNFGLISSSRPPSTATCRFRRRGEYRSVETSTRKSHCSKTSVIRRKHRPGENTASRGALPAL